MSRRARMISATLPVAFLLALAAPSCGREEVIELAPLADAGTGFGDVTITPPDDVATRPCEIVEAGPRQACRADGASCQDGSDCCSSRCQGGVCLAAGTCAGPGTTCTTRDQCCSGRCEPSGTKRVCLNYCLADGASCTTPGDCCSLACHGGVCGGELCAREEAPCSSSADCCSGVCDTATKRCRTGDCKGTGEECEIGDCCSRTCTSDGGAPRCDYGPGPCRPTGAFCGSDSDCCRPPCAVGANGYKVCAAPALPDGEGCTSNADCKSRVCTGVPPVCGAPAAQCKTVGTPCNVSSDCCSDVCQAGFCVSKCPVR